MSCLARVASPARDKLGIVPWGAKDMLLQVWGPQVTSWAWMGEEAPLHLFLGFDHIHSADLHSGDSPSVNSSHPLVCESNPLQLKTGTLFLARMPHFPYYPWVSWPWAVPGISQVPSARYPAVSGAALRNVEAPSPYGPHGKLDLPCPSQGLEVPRDHSASQE